jgi:hypothetical protein
MSTRFKADTFTRIALISGIVSTVLAGCSMNPGIPEEDTTALYRELMPRSILVFPPLNESLDANAPYSYVTTVTQPIAEQGYYVFPVAVIDELMKENGLPTPADMHAAPLHKIDEIIGADAVLYITLEDFGQKFDLLSSSTVVDARAELVDVKTGQVLWKNTLRYVDSSNDGGGTVLGSLVNAVVKQVIDSIADKTHDATIIANQAFFRDPSDGLLLGPLHPEFVVEGEAEGEAVESTLESPATEAAGAE